MRCKIYSIIIILLVFIPLNLRAEHDCVEERPYGHQIKVRKTLPKHWLMIGDRLISDQKLHAILRSKFTENYISGVDNEGFKIDHFCGYKNGIYFYISNGDFGPLAEFSSEAPKCENCNPVMKDIKYFVSGSGLKIGQDKATASSILGYIIKDDITSISFEEIERDKKHNISHSQNLRVEFHNNKLIRFSIDDYRERND